MLLSMTGTIIPEGEAVSIPGNVVVGEDAAALIVPS